MFVDRLDGHIDAQSDDGALLLLRFGGSPSEVAAVAALQTADFRREEHASSSCTAYLSDKLQMKPRLSLSDRNDVRHGIRPCKNHCEMMRLTFHEWRKAAIENLSGRAKVTISGYAPLFECY
jgi:hypothetical protein